MATKKAATKRDSNTATAHAASSPRRRGVKTSDDAADAVDEQLERYRSMRDFQITAEPNGRSGKTPKHNGSDTYPFVIQKHDATRLHYDFRLGWNGVLKSWAVTKGPSYFTGDKRLAVQVEDHPMEYGGFEGIIPKGQYGGGTVMIWDQGTWSPQQGEEDVNVGLRKGSLKFVMHGTKMRGKWALIRMGGHAGREAKPNWLLIKEHDSYERTAADICITEEMPGSVVTGRSLDAIAQAKTHVWNSKETAGKGQAWLRQKSSSAVSPATDTGETIADRIRGLPKEPLPLFIEPQLAQQVDHPPADDGWLHELKLDGYRIQARKDGKKITLLTRTGLDWTHRLKIVAGAIAALQVDTALLDGEVVVLDESGGSSFARLQASFEQGEKHSLTYFCFDLLHLNGHTLRGLSLERRKELMAMMFTDTPETLRISEHLEARGDEVFRKACELHAEGIVSKRRSAKYTSGRGAAWVKSKCVHEQEFVIGGFTLPSNGIHGVGALLLGYYDDNGTLHYAGRTGTGFTQKIHRMLRDRLDALRIAKKSFASLPADAQSGAVWVRPDVVAQVRFSTWTNDHLLRQASYQGLREDKPAVEVRREDAAPKPRGSHSTKASIRKKDAVTPTQSMTTAPVRLTHADKIVDAESKLSKQQLADYYWAVAAEMLPHIADRPLSLVRCPEGSTKPCFYQKHTSSMLPPGIESVMVKDKKSGKPEPYITLSSAEALAGLGQMSVLEIHPWGSHNQSLERPDRIILDLDPDISISWKRLAASATEIRSKLKKIGLESFLKTTGGKGLHLVIPIKPEHAWPTIKNWVHEFVLSLEKDDPRLYLTKMTKAARKGKIYLDYLRNERGATAVAPFSPRARSGAPVSLPLHWADLKLAERPVFAVSDFASWQERLKRDPWKAMASNQQSISKEILAGSI